MPKITPCLWFDDRIEEAVNYYVSVFKEGRILDTSHHEGRVLVMTFVIQGQQFMALNGGPEFKFSEAVSFYVNCKDQAEVDYYWDTFIGDGGKESMCGWLTDKYGLSWQIVPEALPRLLNGSDRAGAARATQAMLQMRKMDVDALERAYSGA